MFNKTETNKDTTVTKRNFKVSLTKENVAAAIVATIAVDATVAATKFVTKRILNMAATKIVNKQFDDLSDAVDGVNEQLDNIINTTETDAGAEEAPASEEA